MRDFEAAGVQLGALEHEAAGTPRAAGYRLLAAYAKAYAESPPPPDWTGEIVLSNK